MENNSKSIANTIVTHNIDFKVLAALGGLCLTHHEKVDDIIVDGDPETLAIEIATQVGVQSTKAGIDALDPKAVGVVCFSIPVWAVCFITDLINTYGDEGNTIGDICLHWRPFANSCLDIIEGKEQGLDYDELPAFRLN